VHAIWRSRGMRRGTQIDRRCVRKLVAAENIDRRVVRLDQAVLTPVAEIGAIGPSDRFFGPDGGIVER
jgi:hypothetical protein